LVVGKKKKKETFFTPSCVEFVDTGLLCLLGFWVYAVPWGLNDCHFRWVLAKMGLSEVYSI